MLMKKTQKLQCVVTGKDSIFSGDYLLKKIKEHGSLEKLEKNYICKDVKSLIKRGYNIEQIRNALNVSENVDYPSDDVIKTIEEMHKTNSFKLPTINNNLTGFTHNKSDPEVDSFMSLLYN
jgi:hypothetical protein